MTTEELMTVRSLNMRIRRLEQKLAGLRLLITNVTPIMDVTPRSQRLESKVEWLAVRALDLEHELDDLRGQLSARRITLTEAILSEPVEAVVQSLLIMFYVELCPRIKLLIAPDVQSSSRIFEKMSWRGTLRHIGNCGNISST